MKLCTVIAYYNAEPKNFAYYNAGIAKQMKFLNSHCSIVCGYCSVLCLMAKSKLKNDQIFKFFQIKRNHIVDSPFNEDPKNIFFFQGDLNFGGGTAGNFGKMDNNRDIYCYANRGVMNFERAY